MPTILILDDMDVMRTVLANELRSRGYIVHHMESKANGYDWIYTNRPDLVITDLNSPVVDGFQFLEFMNANPATRAIPVVVLTGFAGDGVKTDLMGRGAAAVVHKGDMILEDFVGLVGRTISNRKNERTGFHESGDHRGIR